MTNRWLAIPMAALLTVVACCTARQVDDKTAINAIADDLEQGVVTGDLLKIEKHISMQARQSGYESNRFVMESSYGASGSTDFTARTIKVMGDSAHLAFVLMPIGMHFSDTLMRSTVRLVKTDSWKIASFHLMRNYQTIDPDSLL